MRWYKQKESNWRIKDLGKAKKPETTENLRRDKSNKLNIQKQNGKSAKTQNVHEPKERQRKKDSNIIKIIKKNVEDMGAVFASANAKKKRSKKKIGIFKHQVKLSA